MAMLESNQGKAHALYKHHLRFSGMPAIGPFVHISNMINQCWIVPASGRVIQEIASALMSDLDYLHRKRSLIEIVMLGPQQGRYL